jgi:hypothetical protein
MVAGVATRARVLIRVKRRERGCRYTALAELSLYPEGRGCAALTTARILEIFSGVARHELTDTDGTVLRTFHPEFTNLQRQVLDLLDIHTSLYQPAT